MCEHNVMINNLDQQYPVTKQFEMLHVIYNMENVIMRKISNSKITTSRNEKRIREGNP